MPASDARISLAAIESRAMAISHPRLVACAALVAAVAAGSPAGSAEIPSSPGGEFVWITLGADAFASASAHLPLRAGGEPLRRIDETEGVVLTRIPRSAIPDLSDHLHAAFRRCGGFVAHESLAEAQAALDRVREPVQPLGGLPFAIDQPQEVAQLMAAVEESQLLATLTALSTNFPNRYHLHHATHHSADWIRDLWAGYAAARPDVTAELFPHPGITPQPSVVLTIPGSTLPDQVVILGAHQDSTRSGCVSNPDCVAPGADDDGSGIATLSEVIRAALAAGFQPQRTVQFMGYAAEEVGLDGSDHLAASYLAAGTDVVAVLQLDMTGFDGSIEDVVLISDFVDAELTAFVADLLETYLPELAFTADTCGYACSDHASWTSRGYRSAFPFEARFGQHNSALHTGNDTVGTLGGSAGHAIKFARLAAAFLVETSMDSTPLLFADGFESGGTASWSATVP